jgi:hypothetical protein
MPFYYYTTAAQEAALAAIYEQDLQQKQAQIDAEQRRTGRIQKFTARAHISQVPRIFDVSSTDITLEGYGPAAPNKVTGGGTYMTDPSFDDKVADFLRRHAAYRVIFQPSGRWGPTVSYCSRGIPASFISEDGTETLVAEDEDKYDLTVG